MQCKGRKEKGGRGGNRRQELEEDNDLFFPLTAAIPQSNNGMEYDEMSERSLSLPAEIHWDEQ